MSNTKDELQEKIHCLELAIEQKQVEIKDLEMAIDKAKTALNLLEYGNDAVYIYCGEKEAFYRPDAKGYTNYLNLAGVFTLERGKQHLSSVGKEKQLRLIPVKQ